MSDQPARTLERLLAELGIETTYLGRAQDAGHIAAATADLGADAVELWLAQGADGVLLLRQLLRQLTEIGRRDVTIVVHRAK